MGCITTAFARRCRCSAFRGHHLGRRPAGTATVAALDAGSASLLGWHGRRLAGSNEPRTGGERAGKRVQVTADDVLSIGELPLVKRASPEFMRDFPVVRQQAIQPPRSVWPPVLGEMRSKPTGGGRFLVPEDVRLHRRVAFIGEIAAEAVRGDSSRRRNNPRGRPAVRIVRRRR
jgi:hypothetical protein